MNFGRGEVAERLQCMSDLGFKHKSAAEFDSYEAVFVPNLRFFSSFISFERENNIVLMRKKSRSHEISSRSNGKLSR